MSREIDDWELERPVDGIEAAGVCFVYFIQETAHPDDAPLSGFIKIGVANSSEKRLTTLQTGNPRKLIIRQLIVGDVAVEHRLHRFWRRKGAGVRDEWFGNGYQREILALGFEIATRQIEAFRLGRRVEARLAACVHDALHGALAA